MSSPRRPCLWPSSAHLSISSTRRACVSALGLSAFGIVFGDIGTSPLYTLKTVLGITGGANWLLTIVTVGLVLAFRKSDNLAFA
ncbi:KUP/HAK/KT family potassium transporter [Collimonas humicola]